MYKIVQQHEVLARHTYIHTYIHDKPVSGPDSCDRMTVLAKPVATYPKPEQDIRHYRNNLLYYGGGC
jgi:hypothetical protein